MSTETNVLKEFAQAQGQWLAVADATHRATARANNGSPQYDARIHNVAHATLATMQAYEKQLAVLDSDGMQILPLTLSGEAREKLKAEIKEARQELRLRRSNGEPVISRGLEVGVLPFAEDLEQRTRKSACTQFSDWMSKKKVAVLGVAAGVLLQPTLRNLALKMLEITFRNGALLCGSLQTTAAQYGVDLNSVAAANGTAAFNATGNGTAAFNATGTYSNL